MIFVQAYIGQPFNGRKAVADGQGAGFGLELLAHQPDNVHYSAQRLRFFAAFAFRSAKHVVAGTASGLDQSAGYQNPERGNDGVLGLSDTAFRINHAGFIIHSAIHKARADARCVLHTHSRAGAAVSCLEEGLVPMTQGGMQFYNRVSYHDFEGFNVHLDEQERQSRNLGKNNVFILRNHGLVTVGETIHKALQRMIYLEQACEIQLDIFQTGRPVNLPPADVCESTARTWEARTAGADAHTSDDIEWAALLRLADRLYPDYRYQDGINSRANSGSMRRRRWRRRSFGQLPVLRPCLMSACSNVEPTFPHPLDHCRIAVREKAAGTRFQRRDTSVVICVKRKIKHVQVLCHAFAAY
jgi:ribulose-5-phosphate 4-epimerase/fuculose-1-phosphate aldolase